jgi:peptide-methionine (S)-S-oxide reductase
LELIYNNVIIDRNTNDGMNNKNIQLATFAAGCFWGVEEAFRTTKGVKSTMVGYTGGRLENPTYRDVCTNKTGHVEAVQVQFDPSEVSYEKLLDLFWSIHDPTTMNRQGTDVGSQYRSMILFHTPEQEEIAKKSKEDLAKSGRFKNKIVTEIIPASTFYKAEEYHQQYYMKRGCGSCYVRPMVE